MSSTQSRSATFAALPALALTALALTALGGCSASGSGREAYFQSRTDTVMFSQGSGQTRVSLWPTSPFGNDLALADTSTSSGQSRVTDSGPP